MQTERARQGQRIDDKGRAMDLYTTRGLASILIGATLAWGACVRDAEAIAPRQLVEVADLGNIVVSPDGSAVAFRLERASIERNTYDTVWYVQDMEGTSPPRRVADGGLPLRDTAGIALPTPAVWSPDGRWIYFRARIDDRVDVWRAAADGSGASPLTSDPADVRDFSLTGDGRTLRYSVGATREEVLRAEQAEYDAGIHVDETTPVGQGLFRSGYTEGRLATQRLSRTWFQRFPLLSDAPARWKAVDLTTGAKRSLTADEIPAQPLAVADLPGAVARPWRLAQDPASGRIAILTRVGEKGGLRDAPDIELAMLARPNARGPVRCQRDLCTQKAITDIQWRPGSDEVLFTVTDPDQGLAQSILRWNVETGDVHPVIHARGLVSGGGRWAPGTCGLSSTALACVASDADRPPRLERVDLETGKRRTLFDPNARLAWDMASSIPVRLLRWTDANGQSFTGQFFPAQRRDGAPAPLFVMYYRCPGFLRGGLGDEWPLATLAVNGIASLCINAAPYRLDAMERYDLGRSAVESAVERLASEGEVDHTRVGMGGLSFGTEATLWTAMRSKLLTAASVSSPPVSPTYYLLGSLKGDAFTTGLQESWQLGAPEETPERWRALSPALNLEDIRVPVLMQLPEQEYIHSLDYAIPLIRNNRADLYVFVHEPHQKFQPRHKLAVYERNLDWFRFWLQDVEDPAPEKAVQYARWRLMRAALSSPEEGADGLIGH